MKTKTKYMTLQNKQTDFPDGLVVKNLPANDTNSISAPERSRPRGPLATTIEAAICNHMEVRTARAHILPKEKPSQDACTPHQRKPTQKNKIQPS